MMTVAIPETLVGQQIDLLSKLNEVIREHPGGASLRLRVAFTPAGVVVAEDEVLVQKIDAGRGVIELHPRKLADLTPGDIVQATQEIDPTDGTTAAYAAGRGGRDCVTSTHPDGSRGHLYWTADPGPASSQARNCMATSRPDGSTGHYYL